MPCHHQSRHVRGLAASGEPALRGVVRGLCQVDALEHPAAVGAEGERGVGLTLLSDWGGVINSGPVSHGPIRLVDLYPLLAQAYRDNYVWLRDFEDDQLLVSPDLFEVVRAFADCRPSA